MSEYDNTVPSGVGFWLFREILGNGGKVLGVRKAARASPSLCFRLVTDEIVDIREYFLDLFTEILGDEGSRKVEDEDLVEPLG